jgi:aquaporin Z
MFEPRYSDKYYKVPFLNIHLPEYVEFGSKVKLLLGEECDFKFQRACAAEFLAMMFFVVMCCGCAMVTLNLQNPNLFMIAASFGFGIMVLAQFIGPLSGGHINNAVSTALFLGGRISFVRCACYTFSQMGGSVLGAFFLWAIFGNNWPAARAFGSNSWDENVFQGGQVFLAEMMGTMLLVYNVFATIDIPAAGMLYYFTFFIILILKFLIFFFVYFSNYFFIIYIFIIIFLIVHLITPKINFSKLIPLLLLSLTS